MSEWNQEMITLLLSSGSFICNQLIMTSNESNYNLTSWWEKPHFEVFSFKFMKLFCSKKIKI